MKGLLFLDLALLFCTQTLVCGTLESDYIKTKVIYEVYKCTKNKFNMHLQKMNVFSLLECGYHCTKKADCRRIMYDFKQKLCFMYESGENCYAQDRFNHSFCFRQKTVCDEVRCPRCPVGYYGDRCQHIMKDCTDGYNKNITISVKSLRSYIKPKNEILEVNCIFNSAGGITLISHRRSVCVDQGSANFNTGWEKYTTGFGTIHGNYWLGLEHVYNILQNNPAFYLTVMARLKNDIYRCSYKTFRLANQLNNYTITIGNFELYTGPYFSLDDAFTDIDLTIDGRPFSTLDKDFTNYNCPQRLEGGWWFTNNINCSLSEITQKSRKLIWRGKIYDEIQLRLVM